MGTFELLLSTALTEKDIVHGQWLALRRQFLKPILVVLGVECLFLVTNLSEGSPDFGEGIVVWLAGMVMLVADMVAVSWVAMDCALVARNPGVATVRAVVRVFILPLVAFWVIVAPMTSLAALAGLEQFTWQFYLGCWLGTGMVADVAFGGRAWRRLETRFRQLAAQQFAARHVQSAPAPEAGTAQWADSLGTIGPGVGRT